MVLQCLGLSHRTAPVGMREQLGYTSDDIPDALARARRDPRLRHLVILSTCNRVELYAALPESVGDPKGLLTEFMASGHGHGVDVASITPALYYHEGVGAARHLCRVATGLDSLVLGESQILAQVVGAVRRAAARRTVSPELQQLFDTAVRAARRARSEAWGITEPASISSVAVEHARRLSSDVEQGRAHVAVVGAGEVGGLVVRALRMHPLRSLTVVNRDYDRAVELAERGEGRPRELSELPEVLREADVVFVTTGASHVILDAATVSAAMGKRAHRPLLIGDISVPRNVDPAARRIDGVTLFDVDEVQPQLELSMQELQRAVPAVEAIIERALETVAHGASLCDAPRNAPCPAP